MACGRGCKKLYRIPDEGMIKGVCAGIARYFDVPVKLVRAIAIVSIFCGLFMLTVVAYIVLTFALEPIPSGRYPRSEQQETPRQLMSQLQQELYAGEQRLRKIERYVTSETFGVRSRFQQL